MVEILLCSHGKQDHLILIDFVGPKEQSIAGFEFMNGAARSDKVVCSVLRNKPGVGLLNFLRVVDDGIP
jgi:hypothetical protein